MHKTNQFLRYTVFFIISFLAIFSITSAYNSKQKVKKQNTTSIKSARSHEPAYSPVDLYIIKHRQNPVRFWITENEPTNTKSEKLYSFQAKVKRLLESIKNIDPEIDSLINSQGDVTISLYENGYTVNNIKIPKGVDTDDFLKTMRLKKEIVILPQHQSLKLFQLKRKILYYRTDWQAIIYPGVDTKDSILIALLVHEMGHRAKHEAGEESATANPNSDIFIKEEVEMHELEHKVLNYFSNGKLEALYTQILNVSTDPANPFSVIDAISNEDLKQLDKIFNTERIDPITVSFFITQFKMGLGIYTINHSTAKMKDKIKFYREYTKS